MISSRHKSWWYTCYESLVDLTLEGGLAQMHLLLSLHIPRLLLPEPCTYSGSWAGRQGLWLRVVNCFHSSVSHKLLPLPRCRPDAGPASAVAMPGLACTYLRRQSMAPFIYHLFRLSDASWPPHLFPNLGHQAEQFIHLGTSHRSVLALALHLREQHQAHPTDWEAGGSTDCPELWHHVCSSLPHTWQNTAQCIAVGKGGHQGCSPDVLVSRAGGQCRPRADWATGVRHFVPTALSPGSMRLPAVWAGHALSWGDHLCRRSSTSTWQVS